MFVSIKYGINAALIAGYIREKLEKTDFYSGDVPWERITIKKLTGTFVRLPERNELNAEINESLIVEFYNR